MDYIYEKPERATHEVKTVEKVENLKIDCALLSNARHCFMTIINRERMRSMMIAGRCVFMKTIYSIRERLYYRSSEWYVYATNRAWDRAEI
jgi:hypothetical protein